MNISYLIYQAERQRSVAEQRETDVQAGRLAASIAKGRPGGEGRGEPGRGQPLADADHSGRRPHPGAQLAALALRHPSTADGRPPPPVRWNVGGGYLAEPLPTNLGRPHAQFADLRVASCHA